MEKNTKSVAIIVAHPDDETLWAGGTILTNPFWSCFIISLCRKNDEDRAPKFYKVLKILHAKGNMGNLDDEPEQKPLSNNEVELAILDLLPQTSFDLIITHNPHGEYTKHLRHEEISTAVISLWNEGKISTKQLWVFAYQDGNKAYFPKAVENTSIYKVLEASVWQKKYSLITDIYGFEKESWEAQTTPKAESFWQFNKAKDANDWLKILNK
ncbi:MAG: PIG-L family deacetylase [Bacteroidota bacterium]